MTNAYDPAFDRLVSAGPIVDMVGDGRMEYDGHRCSAADCDTAVDNDGEMCMPCGDAPHPFKPAGRPGWCACGRIHSIGGYSPVHDDEGGPCPSCRGAGGWQQYDGLIIECPRGCMTRDSAP